MNFSTLAGRLRASSALPTLGLIALVAASPAFAQTTPTSGSDTADAPEEIVVTGSIFRRTTTETPSPVTTLNSEAIAARGLVTIADAVQSIAAGNGGGIPQNFTGAFASGSQSLSLRGLTTNSTLTLFDGLRAAYYPLADDGQRSFVDLNTIPSAIVDRIEVVRDGASSTYGADAIAGVVNVILKKEVKGLEGRVEGGISQRGTSPNQRFQLTYGYGDLDEQGFNFYLSGEYQHTGKVYNHETRFPFNTNDLRSITIDGGFAGRNGNFGFTPPASTSSSGATVAIVRPATLTRPGDILSGVATGTGVFQTLGGCGRLVSHTNAAGTYCEQDLINDFQVLQPEQNRFGGTAHVTANISDKAQAYFVGTFYQSEVRIDQLPQSIRSNGNPVETRGISLPVRLTNGQLNPQNPFAAAGQAALIFYRFGDIPSALTNTSRTYRVAAGVDGTFGSDDKWGYSVAATYMRTDLQQKREGFLYVPGLINAINNGTYNFTNPLANSQAVRDSIAPTLITNNNSDLWQVQATVTRDLAELPGGPLQLGVGGQVRYESINNPTVVPNRDYITINPFQAVGDRYVSAAFFELQAPILEQLEINASGRYDHYSIGFSHFSPKIGAKFTPIKEVAIRGTFSKGFRAPSVPETSGSVIGFTQYEPGTGLSAADKATLQARYGNNSYITNTYGLGNNSTGNPNIKPEKSRAFTGGVVLAPKPWLSLTVDYYNIKKTDLIVSGSGSPASIASNYLLTGNIPSGVTLTLNPADPSNPGLRPTPLSVNFLYSNGTSLKTAGVDAQLSANFKLGDDTRFTSTVEGTRISYYNVDDGSGGGIYKYVGTLGSYAITSASGTPRWRLNWQNTLVTGPLTLSATTYYTSGYFGYADDNSGAGSTCANATETAARYSADAFTTTTGPALHCKVKGFIQVDLNTQFRVNDNFTFYVNIVNALDAKAPFDPNTYGGNNYNPAWSSAGVIGRLFRAGATFKF